MRKTTIAIVIGAAFLCGHTLFANNTTANWGAQISNGVGDASGNPLPNGSNESFLMSNFTTFASAVIGQGNPGGPGSASDGYWTAVSTNSASTLGIQDKEIYYWVFNAPTAGAASQYGIYTNPANSSWVFPDDTTTAQSDTTDLSQVPPDSSGILWGSYSTGVSRDGSSPLYNLASISSVPEPSTWAAAALALGALLSGAIRRKKSH